MAWVVDDKQPNTYLFSDGLVDINFSGIRLTSGGLVEGSPSAISPTAVNDSYNVTSGVQLVVSAELGILQNDTYVCS